jgi:hypothetical protein
MLGRSLALRLGNPDHKQNGGPGARLLILNHLHPEERALARVSKDDCLAAWFETAQERLLTMRNAFHRSASASRNPSTANPPAKARRSQVMTFGLVTMRSRTFAANSP